MIENMCGQGLAGTKTSRHHTHATFGAEHRLVLAPAGRGAFSVSYFGEVIVERSDSPEYDAARVLCSRGIAGRAVTFHAGHGTPCLRFDISALASIAMKRRQDIAGRLRDSDCRDRVARRRANVGGPLPPPPE